MTSKTAASCPVALKVRTYASHPPVPFSGSVKVSSSRYPRPFSLPDPSALAPRVYITALVCESSARLLASTSVPD